MALIDKIKDVLGDKQVEEKVTFVLKQSQSSYELGSAGDRHKIYYWDVKDLSQRLNELKKEGLITENEV